MAGKMNREDVIKLVDKNFRFFPPKNKEAIIKAIMLKMKYEQY